MIQSTVTYSQIEDRLDAEYYKPEYLDNSRLLIRLKNKVSLDDVSKVIISGSYIDQYFESGTLYLRVNNIKDDFDLSDIKYVRIDISNIPEKIRVRKDNVLLTRTGTIGMALVADERVVGAVMSQHITRIEAKPVISPWYLATFLNTRYGRLQTEREALGSIQKELTHYGTKKVMLPLISQKEQQEVERLVKQAFEKRQLAKQKYEEARRLVNEFLGIKEKDFTFEQSFSLPFSKIEDRLDGEYYQPRYLKAIAAIKSGGYKTITLESIASKIRYGTSQKVSYQDRGIPFLRVTDIDNFYSIDPQDGKFISGAEAKNLQPYTVQENDLLISRTGTLGSVVHISKTLTESVFGSYFIKVAPKKNIEILPLFAAIFLNSLAGKLQSERYGSGGIQTNLTIEMIKGLIVPVFEKRQQEQICRIYTEARQAKKESKNLFEQAKQEVEKIITQSS